MLEINRLVLFLSNGTNVSGGQANVVPDHRQIHGLDLHLPLAVGSM